MAKIGRSPTKEQLVWDCRQEDIVQSVDHERAEEETHHPMLVRYLISPFSAP